MDWQNNGLAGVFNEDSASERANSITSSDLDPFLLPGDDQTWAVEDWNWDPFNMFAAPKEVPNVACCQALKKRKVDNTATSAPSQLQQQQGACQPCHGLGHRAGPPSAPAAACCSVGMGAMQPIEPVKVDMSGIMPSRMAEACAATAKCHPPGVLAPPPAVAAAAPIAAAGPQMGGMGGMGLGMPMGLPGNMSWPAMPGMGSMFPAAGGGNGPLASMGWGPQPLSLQMPMPMAQCAPALSMPVPSYPSGVFNQQASVAVPPSAIPSPALVSSGDTTSVQNSADNGRSKPPCCSGNRAGGAPTCSGGRQQADSSNKAPLPAPAHGQQAAAMGGRGGDFAVPGDVSDFASDSEDEEVGRRAARGQGAAQQQQLQLLHTLADVVALHDVGDDNGAMVCQVPGCGKDLTNLKEYHQRYRICDVHIKLQQVMKDGRLQRFCQQCGRFHDLTAFDGNRKSCREQLSKHNARRRRRAQVESAKGKAATTDTAAATVAAAAATSAAGFEGDVGKLLASLMSNPTHLHALRLLLGVPTHPALPAAQPTMLGNLAADGGNDAAAGGSDQTRTYGLARDILAGRNDFAPAFESEHRTVRLSLKLFNKTPADLPADLRNQVTSWLASAPAAMEASIRPGCVFLTVQMLLDEAGLAQASAPGAASSLAEHLLTRTGSPFWHNGMCTLQLGEEIVLLRNGKLENGPGAGRGDGRFPVVRRLGPLAAVAGQPATLKMHGQNLDAPGCSVVLRWGNKHMKAHLQPLSAHRAIVRLPPLPNVCGPVWVEVGRGAYLSPAKQLLVARDEVLVEEINKLDVRNGPLSAEAVDTLLQDLAMVLQHIAGDAGVTAQLPHAAIALKARRLLAMACDMGWAAVATAVLPLACARCSCAAEMVGAIHAASVPSSATGGGDARGLTLLHRAVRSGSIPLLAGMLAWGDSHGYRWRVDAAGPAGITPLHLSAMQEDARATLLLLDHSGWPAAFTHMRSDDGVTPFHLAFQMGHYQVDSLMSSLGGLHQVVDRANNAAGGGAACCPAPRRSRCGSSAGFKFEDDEDAKPGLQGQGRRGGGKDCCSELDPCEMCHCTLPPLLLSINASCGECGRRRMCMEAEAAAACGRGCACAAARPNLRSELGEVCNTTGHSTVFSITALCQGCHGNRVLAVA